MKSLQSFAFLFCLILSSSFHPASLIDPILVAQELSKYDEQQRQRIHDDLQRKRDNLEAFFRKELVICRQNRKFCLEKFDYKSCYKSLNNNTQNPLFPLNNVTISQQIAQQTNCDDMKDAYLKNKEIIDNNVNKAKKIVNEIKLLIQQTQSSIINNQQNVTLLSNTTSQGQNIISLLQKTSVTKTSTRKLKLSPEQQEISQPEIEEEKKSNNLIDKMINQLTSAANIYMSSFLELSPITIIQQQKPKKTKDEISLAQIKTSIMSIEDSVERVNYMKEIIVTFVEILRKFENGQDQLELQYKKSMKRCEKRLNEKEEVYVNMKKYETNGKETDTVEGGVIIQRAKLCELKKKSSSLCDEVYNLCERHKDEVKIQLNQLNDLLLYFEKY